MDIPDIGTLAQRPDGAWRTDASQSAHDQYMQRLADDHKRASEIAQACANDPLLARLDKHLDAGGITNWNARYLIIGDIMDLIARPSPPTP